MLCLAVMCMQAQVYDACEICAGCAMLSHALRAHGYPVAALDINYWQLYAERRPTTTNPLDLLSPAGMAFL